MTARTGSAKKTTAKKTAARKTAAGNRTAQSSGSTGKDLAAGYFAQQAPDKRVLLEKLRALVVKAVPDATVSIKWGVPFYARNGKNICALAGFKEHVAINFFASPDALVDPGKKLEGSGKGNRTLKVRTAGDIQSASIVRWLRAAAA